MREMAWSLPPDLKSGGKDQPGSLIPAPFKTLSNLGFRHLCTRETAPSSPPHLSGYEHIKRGSLCPKGRDHKFQQQRPNACYAGVRSTLGFMNGARSASPSLEVNARDESRKFNIPLASFLCASTVTSLLHSRSNPWYLAVSRVISALLSATYSSR